MKKLFLIFSAITLSYISSAQLQLRGKVLSISKKQMSDTGNITISTDYPLHTSFLLSDEKFIVDNMVNGFRYRLSDKDTATINNDMVISYLTKVGDNMKLIAASEIGGYPNLAKIAVLPFDDGSSYFTEYLVRINKLKNK